MPITEQHVRQSRKNYTLLAGLALLVALLFSLSWVKMQPILTNTPPQEAGMQEAGNGEQGTPNSTADSTTE